MSLHLPLNDETHYMFDEKFIQQFKKEIILINILLFSTTKILSPTLNESFSSSGLKFLGFKLNDFPFFSK